MFDEVMSVKEFAKELGKKESTVRTWIRRNELPPSTYKKVGATIFILADKFKEWIDKGERRDIPRESE